jgi:hypothetical protein
MATCLLDGLVANDGTIVTQRTVVVLKGERVGRISPYPSRVVIQLHPFLHHSASCLQYCIWDPRYLVPNLAGMRKSSLLWVGGKCSLQYPEILSNRYKTPNQPSLPHSIRIQYLNFSECYQC